MQEHTLQRCGISPAPERVARLWGVHDRVKPRCIQSSTVTPCATEKHVPTGRGLSRWSMERNSFLANILRWSQAVWSCHPFQYCSYSFLLQGWELGPAAGSNVQVCITQQVRTKFDVSCQVPILHLTRRLDKSQNRICTRRPCNPLTHASHMLLYLIYRRRSWRPNKC